MTNVLIDGMDATDPVFDYLPAVASGFFLGLNELAEVRVLNQTFNAEYGGHGAAVIEMTTKSGSNQFHGSLWELYRDASLDAKNYFDLGASPIPQFVLRPANPACADFGIHVEDGSDIVDFGFGRAMWEFPYERRYRNGEKTSSQNRRDVPCANRREL